MVADLLADPAYRRAAADVVPERFRVAGGETLPTFVAVDFGLVRLGDRLEARLVELQAFPSLYGYQMMLGETSRDLWGLEHVSPFPADVDRADYLKTVGAAITGGHDPAEVVLMEIDPADDLEHQAIDLPFDYRDDLDVEWTGGPDWFYRVSKFSIPFLRHPWVPRTYFLHEIAQLPDDREHWLLKPLFSYAGGGILFAPTDADIAKIPADRRHLYVLQERVAFTPVIETPFGATQAEIRLMLVREGDGHRLMMPLVRLGRGKMMGVDHNKGLTWVGASAAMMNGNAPHFEIVNAQAPRGLTTGNLSTRRGP